MKIKHRLWISFVIIIIVPIVMTLLAIIAFSNLQGSGSKNYWSEGLQFSNSLKAIYDNSREDYNLIVEWSKTEPASFLNAKKLEALNDELSKKSAYIVVKTDKRRVLYDGTKDRFKNFLNKLPPYQDGENDDDARLFLEEEEPLLVTQKDVEVSAENHISVFLITQANALLPYGKEMIIDLLLSVILILAFTASVLILWIYKGVFSQVNKLAKAAENIKEGNLDFSLQAEGEDEMSVLVNTFESMRSRLQQDALEKIEAENEQRQLISNIAHDLKTPLTSIRGYTEGILDGVADTPEKQRSYLVTIERKAIEMNTLLNELTLYSQIDTNKIPYSFKRQNVDSFFADCVEELGVDLENQNIRISYENTVDKSVLMIADPEQIRRVILNIVGNSVKYKGEKDALIQFRVKDVGDFVQIEIEDNGRGIEVKDLPFIFDRMYRGDVSRNSSIQGSGIGLSVSKKIIEDHGGQIWATSKIGIGTVIYFVLRKFEVTDNGEDSNS